MSQINNGPYHLPLFSSNETNQIKTDLIGAFFKEGYVKLMTRILLCLQPTAGQNTKIRLLNTAFPSPEVSSQVNKCEQSHCHHPKGTQGLGKIRWALLRRRRCEIWFTSVFKVAHIWSPDASWHSNIIHVSTMACYSSQDKGGSHPAWHRWRRATRVLLTSVEKWSANTANWMSRCSTLMNANTVSQNRI